MQVFREIFGECTHDPKSLQQFALKLCEESGEVAQAVLSCEGAPGCAHKGKTVEDVIEEACDCIITACAVIYRAEKGKVDEDHLLRTIRYKLDKWAAKCRRENARKDPFDTDV